jgi:branched-chain amino acid transport system permease protein
VLISGIAGALFSPIAGRVRGLYLAVATLALVFLGQHIMLNAKSVTGGFNGRSVPEMSILGFGFSDDNPADLLVAGVPFERLERLWYLGLVLVVLAWVLARNLLRSRPGRALAGLRDSELAASVMGVPVGRYRAAVFTVSSMFAGCSGALLGLVYERLVPDSFGITLSINLLAMIVIGGLGSVAGAAAGAVFVSALPQVFTYYAVSLPLVVPPGSVESGLSPVEASHLVYGAAILVVLVFAPGGLAGIGRAVASRARFTQNRSAVRQTEPKEEERVRT